jgi:YYY domain-containing protein
MSWLTIIGIVGVWYATVQLVAWAALPLTLRALRALPDRGYSFAKIQGVLLVGVIYWLGYSYGLLRNERGGAWVALLVVAVISWIVGWSQMVAWWRELRQGGRLRALVVTEAIFLLAFVGWAVVRAYDPNIDHTEQPMDLMFMSSIWASPTYPPQDAWFAGYAISYYYLGYWLLTTLGKLTNTLPSIAYNVGQAVWYGLLWTGCFGVVMNLLAWRIGGGAQSIGEAGTPARKVQISRIALLGGWLGGICVAFVGNLMILPEWLYAQGINMGGLARWLEVHNFPENASQTGQWFIDYGWWWWRSSRVISDIDLLGNRSESSPITEYPMFSYLLGDNHPHVMAMPVVLLVVALAFQWLLALLEAAPPSNEVGQRAWWPLWPLDGWDAALAVLALGSLIFLNTWDFPPYWLLFVAVVAIVARSSWRRMIATGGVLALGSLLLYLPYFLTAQSQAGGILPNLFNPTRLPQFLVIFGASLPALIALVLLGWRVASPHRKLVGTIALIALTPPLIILGWSMIAAGGAWGQQRLAEMELPPGATSFSAMILTRWLAEPWTLLLIWALLTFLLAILVTTYQIPVAQWRAHAELVFVLLLGTIGLGLLYAPEFVFLRDNFGSRMNTVFKFYYQGWLLLGLAAAYAIALAVREMPRRLNVPSVLALLSLLLFAASSLFPIAGVYAKTGGFRPMSRVACRM